MAKNGIINKRKVPSTRNLRVVDFCWAYCGGQKWKKYSRGKNKLRQIKIRKKPKKPKQQQQQQQQNRTSDKCN